MGYSPVYRHFKSVEPISFSLAATRTNVGSTGDTTRSHICRHHGEVLFGPVWTYPEVTGIN